MKHDPHPLPVIEVRALRKTFTLHLRDGVQLPVLDGLDLEVFAGECVALVGASGRGKSTLMKCLHGNYGCEAGEIHLRVAGQAHCLTMADPRTVQALRREAVSYVSQFLRAVPRVSALDVVAERALEAQWARTPPSTDDDPLDDRRFEAQVRQARAQAAALLARLRLPESLWPLPPATFSGGEQQRVNIARGFILPTPVLLLDEPTASLDAANRQVVIELIREARQRGAAIVGIFHDEEVRDAVATRQIAF